LELASEELPILETTADKSDDLAAYFIDRLRIAVDNGRGCVLLAVARLPAPIATVTRSMLESVFTTYWASLSDANAKLIKDAFEAEFLRVTKGFLTEGLGTIRNKITGEDKTDEILASSLFATARRPPQIQKLAKEAGLGRAYALLYGQMSALAHGNAMLLAKDEDDFIYAWLPAAQSMLKATHLIVVARILEHRQILVEEIISILNLPR
jgi:Family of unknown function (DUF5677)